MPRTPRPIDAGKVIAELKRKRSLWRPTALHEEFSASRSYARGCLNGLEDAIAIIERLAKAKK
jgi:hypothetical protein